MPIKNQGCTPGEPLPQVPALMADEKEDFHCDPHLEGVRSVTMPLFGAKVSTRFATNSAGLSRVYSGLGKPDYRAEGGTYEYLTRMHNRLFLSEMPQGGAIHVILRGKVMEKPKCTSADFSFIGDGESIERAKMALEGRCTLAAYDHFSANVYLVGGSRLTVTETVQSSGPPSGEDSAKAIRRGVVCIRAGNGEQMSSALLRCGMGLDEVTVNTAAENAPENPPLDLRKKEDFEILMHLL
jgi:hypothetical protein